MSITQQQELISAEKKSIGFDYQFLYFIYKLLALEPNQIVGYEVKDDVHLELSNKKNIYMQLKHSLTQNTQGETVNLTERDSDLWKTLYNWVVIIEQISSNLDEQIAFISNTKFLMVTNKSDGRNPFNLQVEKLKQKETTIVEFKGYIKEVKQGCKGTKPESVKLRKYMDKVINAEDKVLEEFILKIEFEFSFDQVPQKLHDRVLAKNIDSRKVKSVLDEIVGAFELWKFETVKGKGKILIDFEQVNKKLRPILQRGRSDELPRKEQLLVLPTELKEQTFIKELIQIEDIEEEDISHIVQFTTYKLEIFNLLSSWLHEGYITECDKKELEEEAIHIWTNQHHKSHRKSDKAIKTPLTGEECEEILKECAQECIDDMREKQLYLNQSRLKNSESNGLFYYLSDIEEIGWQYKWRGKYK
ncbi:MAG: hypothetical protein AB9856_10615 [Cellulosilyticaceae bacterium]